MSLNRTALGIAALGLSACVMENPAFNGQESETLGDSGVGLSDGLDGSAEDAESKESGQTQDGGSPSESLEGDSLPGEDSSSQGVEAGETQDSLDSGAEGDSSSEDSANHDSSESPSSTAAEVEEGSSSDTGDGEETTETDTGATESTSGAEESGGFLDVGSESESGGSESGTETGTGGEVELPFCDSGDDSLVACYRFDEIDVSGEEFWHWDGSAYGNHAQVVSGVSVVPDERGLVYEVNPDTRLEVEDSLSLDLSTEFSIEVWVKIAEKPGGGQTRFVLQNNNQYSIEINSNLEVTCYTPEFETAGNSSGDFSVDTWTHIACVFDNGDLSLYVDGDFVAMETGAASISTADTDSMGIGNNVPEYDSGVDGRIDDLRIWSRVRTDKEVCEAAERDGC